MSTKHPIPPVQKAPMYVPVREGKPVYFLGLYPTRKGAMAQGAACDDAARVWVAVEKR